MKNNFFFELKFWWMRWVKEPGMGNLLIYFSMTELRSNKPFVRYRLDTYIVSRSFFYCFCWSFQFRAYDDVNHKFISNHKAGRKTFTGGQILPCLFRKSKWGNKFPIILDLFFLHRRTDKRNMFNYISFRSNSGHAASAPAITHNQFIIFPGYLSASGPITPLPDPKFCPHLSTFEWHYMGYWRTKTGGDFEQISHILRNSVVYHVV